MMIVMIDTNISEIRIFHFQAGGESGVAKFAAKAVAK